MTSRFTARGPFEGIGLSAYRSSAEPCLSVFAEPTTPQTGRHESAALGSMSESSVGVAHAATQLFGGSPCHTAASQVVPTGRESAKGINPVVFSDIKFVKARAGFEHPNFKAVPSVLANGAMQGLLRSTIHKVAMSPYTSFQGVARLTDVLFASEVVGNAVDQHHWKLSVGSDLCNNFRQLKLIVPSDDKQVYVANPQSLLLAFIAPKLGLEFGGMDEGDYEDEVVEVAAVEPSVAEPVETAAVEAVTDTVEDVELALEGL